MHTVPIPQVINAAGKLTALGGSAQTEAVATAQANAASLHLDLDAYRRAAGAYVAQLTGAEAACITSGAAAGIAISVAAVLTGTDPARIRALPQVTGTNQVALQAGHAVNFGAEVVQMIRMAGGAPIVVGSANAVPPELLAATLAGSEFAAYLHVLSHHCVQENMTSLNEALAICQRQNVPVIVDAAAEEDLTTYVASGADLVTYSGGKAIAGPTSGFIAGNKELVAACEAQFQGIARTMKVGKEQIAGLMTALDAYDTRDEGAVANRLAGLNSRLMEGLRGIDDLSVSLRQDEAGRHFARVALSGSFEARKLANHLAAGDPAAGIPPIRTRNHFLDQGLVLVDPRELIEAHVDEIVRAVRAFFTASATGV